MADPRDRMLDHFRETAPICAEYGSPFTGRLIECFARDFEAGGPVAALLGGWAGNPLADGVAVRLAGALHAAVLTGRAPALAAEYPAQRADWDMAAVWPLAREFLEREQAWVARFISSPPQTNETRRAIALLAGFLSVAAAQPGPIDTLELGASAGLNLNWDAFSYRAADWHWGPPSSVQVETDWSGPPPQLSAAVHVRSRAACDQNPLELRDPAQRLRLRSYIWADQRERLARFDAAADLAIARGVHVEQADAAAWIAQRLAQRASDGTTVVYHSVFLQYPPRDTRNAIIDCIRSAGEAAGPRAPLVWLRLEPEVLLGGPRDSQRFVVDTLTWPGGERRTLAFTDGHVRAVQAL